MLQLKIPNIKVPNKVFTGVYEFLQKIAPYSPDNKYLEGPFAPVPYERVETDLEVIGTIPAALSGTYARIGPNPINVKNPGKHHWFLGDGMVHGIKIKNGKFVWYRNRWIGSDTVNDAFNRPHAPGPRNGIFDIVNTNVFGHAGRIWASIEAGTLPVELDAEFETVKHGLFDSDQIAPYTAHPHLDPATGELHAVTYSATQLNYVQYIVVDADAKVTKIESIPLNRQPMIHDCAITQKYVLVFDFPVLLSVKGMISGESVPYHWRENSYSRVGVMPRNGTAADIRWCTLDPCYVFHSCNAFDQDDGSIVLDAVVHEHMFKEREGGPEVAATTFERWTLHPETGTVDRKVISDVLQEFPRFDERLSTKPYRYAYTIGASLDFTDDHPLYRHDLLTGETIVRNFGANVNPKEVNFVPRHADAAEDDGWLLTFVTNAANQTTDFVILDAQDMLGEPVARVRLPWQMPLGFHSNWIAD